MAKFGGKKSTFGVMDDLEPTIPGTTPSVTPTPTYTPAHSREPKVREKKTERLQLVVRPSTKSRLAKYAQDHNTSSNEVVQKLLDKLLEESGY